jgi:hypothetical protein
MRKMGLQPFKMQRTQDDSGPPSVFFGSGTQAGAATAVEPSEKYGRADFFSAHEFVDIDSRPPRAQRDRSEKSSRRKGRHHNAQKNAEVPPATEDEWKHRETKRKEPIKTLKESSVYNSKENQDFMARRGIARPQTPDPSWRISKRAWEDRIADWRGDWRKFDGVRTLVGMGFSESDSRTAWQNAKVNDSQAHDQNAHLERAVELLTTATIV